MPISVARPPEARGLTAPLRRIVRATLAHVACTPGEVTVVLTDDAQLRELNRQYRKMDRTTDVLSFGYSEGERRIEGDLVISMDRVRVQAGRYRVTRGRELARLVVHGALHLAGYDHHAAEERRVMRRAEADVMRAVNVEVNELDRVLAGRAPRARAHR